MHQDLGLEDAAVPMAARMFISPMSTHAVLWTMRSYAKHCIMRSQREGTQARGPMRLRRLCIMCIAV